jgi:phosphate starvation-inducible PhoH-like protein
MGGRRKNIKDLAIEDEMLINEKMMGNGSYKEYTNGSSALNYKVELKCKNQKQKDLCKLIKEKEIVFCSGTFGTGKSYCINGISLELLKRTDNTFEKILIIIPTLENSGKELYLGMLPGTKDEKISVYTDADTETMKKILKKSNNIKHKEIIDNLIKCGKISFEVVNYSLGKTWDNSIILLNEAENFNKQEMLLLISRIGEGSKIIVSGDVMQTLRKSIITNKEDCGLTYAIKKLKDMDEVGCIEFTKEDIVRNPLLFKIIEKWHEKDCG